MRVGAALSRTDDAGLAAAEAADAAAQALQDGGCDLAVVFASPEHADGLRSAIAAIGARLAPQALIGGVAQGVVGPGEEVEEGPALSVWAASFDGEVEPFRTWAVRSDEGGAILGWPDTGRDDVTVLLADPFSYPIGDVVAHVGDARPGHRVVGGLLTAGRGNSRLVVGDTVHDDGAVGVVLRGVGVEPVVSQGCRPVGEPFVVTRVEGTTVIELGGVSALERLREVFAGASPDDQALIRHGLQVGLVADEYRDRYGAGDFLIRGVLGADGDNGGLIVGDTIAVGQTLQFQVRDAATADADLRAALARAPQPAAGALLFTCNGRGERFFGEPDHDVLAVSERLTPTVAGAFCAGEVGPVGDRSFLHGYTASLAVFADMG